MYGEGAGWKNKSSCVEQNKTNGGYTHVSNMLDWYNNIKFNQNKNINFRLTIFNLTHDT